MKHMNFGRNCSVALSVLGIALFSSAASAQAECGDTTCEAGFECKTYSSDCPTVDCAEGEECASCEPVEQQYCERAACESDADCGDIMVCGTLTQYDCPAVEPAIACAEGADCPEPAKEDVACTETEVQQCAPRWELPCEADADCGDGFTCTPIESCSCPGSEGSAGAAEGDARPADGGGADPGAGAATMPAPDGLAAGGGECTCEPTGDNYCQPNQIECTADSDCPADWTCETNEQSGSCAVSSDGQEMCDTVITSVSQCQPPYDRTWGSGDVLEFTADGGEVAAASGQAGGTPVSAEEGRDLEGGSAAGPVVDDATGSGDADGAEPPVENESAPNMSAGENPVSMSAKGCAVASSTSGSSKSELLWAALGLGLVLGRRRTRRS